MPNRTDGAPPVAGPALTLTLPEPPSANRWWRMWRGRMVLSAEAREYKERAWALALRQRGAGVPAAAGPVAVRIEWRRGRKRGDLDKRVGVLLDALQGVCYESDAQIAELHAVRVDDAPGGPGVTVTITTIAGPPAAEGGPTG